MSVGFKLEHLSIYTSILPRYCLMEDNIDTNKILENHNDSEEFEFRYNFINMPWDDRSTKSKIGIVALLIVIFLATMAGVANNFVMHYRGFSEIRSTMRSVPNCFKAKVEKYNYVAKIHSASSKELLCVGAVVSPTSILANGICVKSGPIRVYIGSPTNPPCKKGFTIDIIDPISYDGEEGKLVRLSSHENIKSCAHMIPIGTDIDWNSRVHIIGRALSMGRPLSRQMLKLSAEMKTSMTGKRAMNVENMICVEDQLQCPVKVSDLLVQDGYLFGLADTSGISTGPNRTACFAALNVIRNQLKDLDPDISFV